MDTQALWNWYNAYWEFCGHYAKAIWFFAFCLVWVYIIVDNYGQPWMKDEARPNDHEDNHLL